MGGKAAPAEGVIDLGDRQWHFIVDVDMEGEGMAMDDVAMVASVVIVAVAFVAMAVVTLDVAHGCVAASL